MSSSSGSLTHSHMGSGGEPSRTASDVSSSTNVTTSASSTLSADFVPSPVVVDSPIKDGGAAPGHTPKSSFSSGAITPANAISRLRAIQRSIDETSLRIEQLAENPQPRTPPAAVSVLAEPSNVSSTTSVRGSQSRIPRSPQPPMTPDTVERRLQEVNDVDTLRRLFIDLYTVSYYGTATAPTPAAPGLRLPPATSAAVGPSLTRNETNLSLVSGTSSNSLCSRPSVHSLKGTWEEGSDDGERAILKYSVVAELGRGQYGAVLLVVDAEGETFAIKTMHKGTRIARKMLPAGPTSGGSTPNSAGLVPPSGFADLPEVPEVRSTPGSGQFSPTRSQAPDSLKPPKPRRSPSTVTTVKSNFVLPAGTSGGVSTSPILFSRNSSGVGFGMSRHDSSITTLHKHSSTNLLAAPSPSAAAASVSAPPQATAGVHTAAAEIAIMKKLKHKHILQLFEVIEDTEEDECHLVMQYAEGGPIAKLQSDHRCTPLPIPEAMFLMRQVASGLSYLHKKGFVHRDIKPENILVHKGDALIADFGLSSLLVDSNGRYVNKTNTGPIAGTIAFSAPEVVAEVSNTEGDPALDQAADVWAFGVTLYALLFGVLPFNHNTRIQMVKAILTEEVAFPSGTTPELCQLLRGLLEKDPKKRMTLKTFRNHPEVLRGATQKKKAPSRGASGNWFGRRKTESNTRDDSTDRVRPTFPAEPTCGTGAPTDESTSKSDPSPGGKSAPSGGRSTSSAMNRILAHRDGGVGAGGGGGGGGAVDEDGDSNGMSSMEDALLSPLSTDSSPLLNATPSQEVVVMGFSMSTEDGPGLLLPTEEELRDAIRRQPVSLKPFRPPPVSTEAKTVVSRFVDRIRTTAASGRVVGGEPYAGPHPPAQRDRDQSSSLPNPEITIDRRRSSLW